MAERRQQLQRVIESSVNVPESQLPRRIELAPGDTVSHELASLGTSGYRWEHRLTGDPDVVEVRWTHGRPPESTEPLPVGVSLPEVCTIRAMRPGRTELHLEQRRPWERDKPALATVTVEVIVRPTG